MNELNKKVRHTLGWCLYSPPEKECQHLPANEDDEQTISELSALFTEQIRLGRKYVGGKICVCELAEPCMSQCTCASPVMSGGCMRCATYGNPAQRQAAAEKIAQSDTTLLEGGKQV